MSDAPAAESGEEGKFVTTQLCPLTVLRLEEYFKKAARTGKEFGGLLVPNGVGHLRIDDENKGNRKEVSVPTGPIMFHTHPANCEPLPERGRLPCAIGVPSARDMNNILITAMVDLPDKFVAHIIISHDGLYVVEVPPAKRRALLARACKITGSEEPGDDMAAPPPSKACGMLVAAINRVFEELDAFETKYRDRLLDAKTERPYETFVKDWKKHIRTYKVAGVAPFRVTAVDRFDKEFRLELP
jgi:hypothetical protein